MSLYRVINDKIYEVPLMLWWITVYIPLFVQSLRDTNYFYNFAPDPKDGIFAVRYKQHKAHFITQGWVQCEYLH